MKLLLSIFGSAALYVLLFTGGSQLTGCTKTTIQYDTTVVRDTTIVKDSTFIVDTVRLLPSASIVGLFIGLDTAANEPQAGGLYYSYQIQADGTMLFTSEGANGETFYGNGTWSLTGLSFTATVNTSNLINEGVVQNITAIFDSKKGVLTSGVWANAPGYGVASGKFTLYRVN